MRPRRLIGRARRAVSVPSDFSAACDIRRPLNFTVRRMRQSVPSSSEHRRVPTWFRRLGPLVLLAILLSNLGVISYAWLHKDGASQARMLVVLWVLAAVAVLLLVRLYAALNRRASTSSGANLEGNVGPSNNRWRGP